MKSRRAAKLCFARAAAAAGDSCDSGMLSLLSVEESELALAMAAAFGGRSAFLEVRQNTVCEEMSMRGHLIIKEGIMQIFCLEAPA
jgi:hypothetical protein